MANERLQVGMPSLVARQTCMSGSWSSKTWCLSGSRSSESWCGSETVVVPELRSPGCPAGPRSLQGTPGGQRVLAGKFAGPDQHGNAVAELGAFCARLKMPPCGHPPTPRG